jgi:hypothetical protein
MRLLETAGYDCIRAAGSHGVFDIVALSASSIVLVQVKTNHRPSPAEIECIRDFPAPDNAHKQVHIWKDRKKLPEVMRL